LALFSQGFGNDLFGFLLACFCALAAGANLFPEHIGKYFSDAIAVAVILVSVWLINISLTTNMAEGNNPVVPYVFIGVSVLYLYRRFKHLFVKVEETTKD